MRRAIELAAHGLGTTSPNPVVGCVVLDAGGRVVGEGWHERAGGLHAEVVALAGAGAAARGGTAVVTLEPCAHVGRTGPCVEALRTAGVRRVVFAVRDPTAAGGGGHLLRERGLDVHEGLLGREAARVNEAWLTLARTGRPHVHWKFAATLDGRSAAPDGSSRWITSAAARADVHLLRSRVDAIMVGVGTILRDDPELTARDGNGVPLARQPLRVIVDSKGRTPSTARVLRPPGKAWIVTAAEAGAGDGGVSLSGVLEALAGRGVVSVLLEGGPRLAGGFLATGLVDRVTTYLAPALLGAGAPALDRPAVTSIGDTLRLDIDETRMIGPDIKVSGRPSPARASSTAQE